jgi:16S rRNA U516 pseudouridylate synthase RsuA-like enzyme
MINYTEQILIKLKEGQNEILKRDADKFGLTVSSYIRLRLFNSDLIDLT